MGMRLPVYNAPARISIELSLPWHSSTIPIADVRRATDNSTGTCMA